MTDLNPFTMRLSHAAYISAAFLLALTFFVPHCGYGQIKKAERLMKEGRPDVAAKILKRDFYGKNSNPESGFLLAKCHYSLHEYDAAREVMERIQDELEGFPEKTRFYIDVMVAAEDFGEAYLAAVRLITEDESDPRSYIWFNKVADLAAWDTVETGSELTSIRGLNTPYNEYAPYCNDDESLWFVTDINSMQAIFPASYSGQNIHLLYKTEYDTLKREVKRPSMLVKNRKYYDHDGPLSRWPGTDFHAVTMRDIDAPVETSKTGIFFIDLKKGEDPIPFRFNQSYNTGHPAFNADGTRMYFSSDRPGGSGGMDIWYCDREEGQWTIPKNLGPAVNTSGNEVFPFYREGRLFFSSDRRDMGYGGLDLYYASEMLNFKHVTNLRSPINSPRDDFSLNLCDYNSGFIASNRDRGAGGDDIYRLIFYPERIVHKDRSARFAGRRVAEGTKVTISDGRGQKVKETFVDPAGIFSLSGLTSAETYTLEVEGMETRGMKVEVLNDGDQVADVYEASFDGVLRVELLPPEDYTLGRMDDEDDSAMAFDLSGQVREDEGQSDFSGASVILKSGDATVSKVRTDEDGRFSFNKLSYSREYTIMTEGVTGAHQVDIFGNTGAPVQTIQPVGENAFLYTRAYPAADWMMAAPVTTAEVNAALLTANSADLGEGLFKAEGDKGGQKAVPDSDGFLLLKNVRTMEAYELTFGAGSLRPEDRLLLLDARGDTTQSVRPADDKTFRFEYMLPENYGAPEPAGVPETAEAEPEFSLFRGLITDYNLGANRAMVLTDQGESRRDTLFVRENGNLVLREITEEKTYSLRLAEGTVPAASELRILDTDGNLMTTGSRDGDDGFVFSLAAAEEAAKDETAGPQLMSLAGKAGGTASENAPRMRVYDAERNLLTEGYAAKDGTFQFSEIPEGEVFYLEFPEEIPEIVLVAVPERDGSVEGVREAERLFRADLQAPLADAAVAEDKEERREFTVPQIYYRFNSYYLLEESRRSLDMLTRYMVQNPEVRIEIRAYTDSRGPADYNLLLSKRRADAVKEYLTKKGVSEGRMKTKGLGETNLVNSCTDGTECSEEEHAANRRTTFVILD